MTTKDKKSDDAVVKAAFGAKNRGRLIDIYLDQQPKLAFGAMWKHVYRLLLWIDQTTGLAHCYESDKCQPGKPWYGRSLAFHDWISTALNIKPSELVNEIDWLFRRATSDLAAEVLRNADVLAAAGAKQRKAYEDRGFPRPGEDPELVSIVTEILGAHFKSEPQPHQWQMLVHRIRQYLKLENKRRNLLGEGFEDVLAAVLRRSPGGAALDLRTRYALHDLPGFHRPRQGDKANKVDLAVLRPGTNKRLLVTAKWSVRADRERQFPAELEEYKKLESHRQPFEYVFVTSEFDPARLMRACDALDGNSFMFAYVVHISTDALLATYGAGAEDSMKRVREHIEAKRLISLDEWIARVTAV